MSNSPLANAPGSRERAQRTPLIIKRASASGRSGERNEHDYNVLGDGVVVGRIMRALVAPVGSREAAMAAFAKSWRRE